MKDREADILWQGDHFYVFRVSLQRIEIRKHEGTHSAVVGWGPDEAAVIRTAKRLEQYPQGVQ